MSIHKSAKIIEAKKTYVCEKCGVYLSVSSYCIRVSSRVIKPFIRCLWCGAVREEINDLIMKEIDNGVEP